jgi:hypothetical protein
MLPLPEKKRLLVLIQKSHHLFNIPNVICNSRFHRWRNAQRLVNTAKVVVHEIQRQCRDVVLNFLAECVCQPCETSHRHTHGQIRAFNKASRNVLSVRAARNRYRTATNYFRRTVGRVCIAFVPVQLNQHGVIDVRSERMLYGVRVDSVTVCSECTRLARRLAKSVVNS